MPLKRMITSRILKSVMRDIAGVTSIEYALLGALIFLVIIAALTSVGSNLKTPFNTVAGVL